MNKTIKIIDLLNKIANGEEVPEKIKYDTKEMLYDHNKQDYLGYYSNNNGEWLFQYLFDRCKNTEHFINDFVEIIEDNDKLEKIEITGEQIKTFYDGGSHFVRTNRKDRHLYIPTLNKIINHINKIEEKLDER